MTERTITRTHRLARPRSFLTVGHDVAAQVSQAIDRHEMPLFVTVTVDVETASNRPDEPTSPGDLEEWEAWVSEDTDD